MTAFVIDCSLTMAWCFVDEANQRADRALDALAENDAVAPAIWPFEVANVLLMAEKRKRITVADSTKFLNMLQALPIRIDDVSRRGVFGDVASTARAHGLTSYDAAYLELAMREGIRLASLDSDLNKAARALGVILFD